MPISDQQWSIVERVVKTGQAYMIKTGKAPTVVYLGREEIHEMEEMFERGNQTHVREATRGKSIFGYKVIEVKEDQYLEVG